MNTWTRNAGWALLSLAAWLILPGLARAQYGIILSGGGAVQRSMGGTGTATTLDSLGGLFWNPATLSGLPHNEMTFGAEFLVPDANLSSSLKPSSFGPGIPAAALAGSTHSDNGAMVLPNVGWSHHLEETDVTLGLGLLSAAGFGVNYPASTTNPILTPQPPFGFGAGNVFSDLQVFQIVPTASLQVTERLSVGFSPIIDIASLRVNPLIFAPPTIAGSYVDGMHSHLQWGAGFQIGVFYSIPDSWHFGASYKSPQWFQTFEFNSTDEKGRPLPERVRFDIPSITSFGVSFTGVERWVFAGDIRYIDYHNAKGFDESGFAPDGSVRGLGWDDQFVLALGSQYAVSDSLSLRMGYSYNTNPQHNNLAFFNIAAPTIIQHTLYAGFSWNLSEMVVLSLAYVHAFENEVHGPFAAVFGTIPGGNVQSRVSADAGVLGLTVRY